MKLRTRRRREFQHVYPDTSEEVQFCAEVADDTPTPEQQYSQRNFNAFSPQQWKTFHWLPGRFCNSEKWRSARRGNGKDSSLSISAVKSRMLRGGKSCGKH